MSLCVNKGPVANVRKPDYSWASVSVVRGLQLRAERAVGDRVWLVSGEISKRAHRPHGEPYLVIATLASESQAVDRFATKRSGSPAPAPASHPASAASQ